MYQYTEIADQPKGRDRISNAPNAASDTRACKPQSSQDSALQGLTHHILMHHCQPSQCAGSSCPARPIMGGWSSSPSSLNCAEMQGNVSLDRQPQGDKLAIGPSWRPGDSNFRGRQRLDILTAHHTPWHICCIAIPTCL